MTIPLTENSIDIINARKAKSTSPFVFESKLGTKGHLVEPKRAFKTILTRAGIKDFRIHDLRRTLGSLLAGSGANSYIISKTLGHKSSKATDVYARLNLDPVREAMEKATGIIK